MNVVTADTHLTTCKLADFGQTLRGKWHRLPASDTHFNISTSLTAQRSITQHPMTDLELKPSDTLAEAYMLLCPKMLPLHLLSHLFPRISPDLED